MIARGAGRMKSRRLQGRAHLADRVAEGPVGMAADGGGTRRWSDQPELHPQRGRLASAVWAKESGDNSRTNLRRQIVDGHDLAESLSETAELDHGDPHHPIRLSTREVTRGPASVPVAWPPPARCPRRCRRRRACRPQATIGVMLAPRVGAPTKV